MANTTSTTSPETKAPKLAFEPMKSTHKDHQPTEDGAFLVLRNVESPNPYIKKGDSKYLRTGVKLVVPEGYLCAVADRRVHGSSFMLYNVQFLTPGTSGEVSILCGAGHIGDRNVRMGEEIGVAWLVKTDGATKRPEPKTEKDESK